MPSVVLITGVSRFVGGRLAAQLAADPSIDRVIGIDTAPPRAADLPLLGRTEFVRADIRNPLIAKVMSQARVQTVVHSALIAAPSEIGGRVSMQEMNVIGTMQLLAACQKSDTVERVVLRSTTAVYGSGASDPAVLTEDTEPHGPARGYAKDAAEVEGYVRGFGRRRPDVEISVLRLAPVVGPTVDTALTRYLRSRVVPTIAGFDPRLQLLHESDAIEAIRIATVASRPGVVNVAGDGVVTLSQLVRRTGRVRVPVPLVGLGPVAGLVRNRGATEVVAAEGRLLRFGRVVDTTRLRTEFGYHPRWTTVEAAQACVSGGPPMGRVTSTALRVGSELLVGRRRKRFAVTGT
jgi:UDP-glucose 4-epimerase